MAADSTGAASHQPKLLVAGEHKNRGHRLHRGDVVAVRQVEDVGQSGRDNHDSAGCRKHESPSRASSCGHDPPLNQRSAGSRPTPATARSEHRHHLQDYMPPRPGSTCLTRPSCPQDILGCSGIPAVMHPGEAERPAARADSPSSDRISGERSPSFPGTAGAKTTQWTWRQESA